MPNQFFSLMWQSSRQKCRSFFLFFFTPKKMKGWQSEADRLIKGHGEGQSWSRSCSSCTCMHYHSFAVCYPPLFCHSLSLFLPPTFSFHPRPTFLVVVGVAIRHGAHWETQSKTGTDSPRCIDHSGGLLLFLGPLMLRTHSTHQVCCVPFVQAPCALTSPQSACFFFPPF